MTVLERLLSDFDRARDNQQVMYGRVKDWRETIYLKEPNGSSTDVWTGKYKSIMKMKDIEKVIESSIPSIVEPFVSDEELISVGSKGGEAGSMIVETLLNEQWNKEIDSLDFMTDLARVVQSDGTAIVKVGWRDNNPSVEVIPFEECFIDPSARTVNDIKFVIQARRVQIQDIIDNTDWYGKWTYEELSGIVSSEATNNDRYTGNDNSGYDSNFNYEDGLRQYVDLYEYYGEMEVDGEVKPIVGIFSGSMLLNVMDSPYPDSWYGIPFDLAQYTKRPFSIYGDSVAELIRDYQSIRTGFMRAILENAQNANSNQKWNKKGALDVMNKKKMMTGLDFETNVDPERAIVQGEFNQVNPSVFQIMEQMKVEQEELTGIGRLNSGLDPRALNSGTSATAARLVQTNADKRLLMIVRNIASMMKRVFSKMLDLNMMMLEPTVINVYGENIVIDRNMLIGSKYNLEVSVNTAGTKDAQNQNILMMVQQLQGNYQVIPGSDKMISQLLAKLASNLKLNNIAKEMKMTSMGMNQEQQMMKQQQQQIQDLQMQLAQQEQQAKIAKDNSAAALNMAKAETEQVKAMTEAYGLND